MRGRFVFMGYLENEAKTTEAIDDEEWLHSGDVGKFDEVCIVNMIRRGLGLQPPSLGRSAFHSGIFVRRSNRFYGKWQQLNMPRTTRLFNYKENCDCRARIFEYIYITIWKFSDCFPNFRVY